MAHITLDDFVQLANTNEEVKSGFLENPILAMKNSGVEFDTGNLMGNISPSNLLATESPPAPTVEVFWWGYRVRVSAEFLKWLSLGGVTVGAVIMILAPLLIALGPLGIGASAVVAAFAAYLLIQNTVLMAIATTCGGNVCIDALWITPFFWKPACCEPAYVV